MITKLPIKFIIGFFYHGASSIKAGLFLSEFTAKVPFAHIDIAGTAFLSKPNFCLAAEAPPASASACWSNSSRTCSEKVDREN